MKMRKDTLVDFNVGCSGIPVLLSPQSQSVICCTKSSCILQCMLYASLDLAKGLPVFRTMG